MFRRKSGLALAARLREAGLLGYRKQRPALKVAVSSRSVPAPGWSVLRIWECKVGAGNGCAKQASPQFLDYNSG